MHLLSRSNPVIPSRRESLGSNPPQDRWTHTLGGSGTSFSPALLQACSNRACTSGWLHLWRSRSAPVFEGGWNCSAACTSDRMRAAISRELDSAAPANEKHRHRIPLGLLMLEQGWINAEQLRGALEKQRAHRSGRLGHWLVSSQGVSEQLVTRALGLQWTCPVLTLDSHDPEALAPVLPRLFLDAFGVLPLRVAAGKLLYLGFEDRLDPVLALAFERMSGLRVEAGVVRSSRFDAARSRMLEAKFPAVELLEASSAPALARVLSRKIEKVRPVEARLVRVHHCLWLRMWTRHQVSPVPDGDAVQDIVCTIADC